MSDDASTLHEPPAPSYREILRFYYPLALSWLFMAMEMPIASAVTSHSDQPKIQAAALLLMMGLALFLESPVIDLLSTSTTLTKTRGDFLVIRRFALWMMVTCVVAHLVFCLTPLYDWVTLSVLGIPKPVAEATWLPMLIMLPWSPAIGWRRFLQGILIRAGQTRRIGFGTSIRVGTIGLVCFGLYFTTDLAGIVIAAIALSLSVTAESVFIHFASRPILREKFDYETEPPTEPPVDMAKLKRFHFPLTATTITFMTTIPLVGAALAQTSDDVLAMAAWQVSSSLAFLHRTVVFALPEPIIALYKGPNSARKLGRFCLMVGAGSAALMLLAAAFGAERYVFLNAYGAPADVTIQASLAYLACFSLPVIGAFQSYLRGMLTAHHLTVARLGAILAYTVTLVVLLGVGIVLEWPGVWVAAVASTGSAIAEVGVLAGSWQKAKRRGLALSPA